MIQKRLRRSFVSYKLALNWISLKISNKSQFSCGKKIPFLHLCCGFFVPFGPATYCFPCSLLFSPSFFNLSIACKKSSNEQRKLQGRTVNTAPVARYTRTDANPSLICRLPCIAYLFMRTNLILFCYYL